MSKPKPKSAVVLGTGSLAEVVDFYLTHDSDYEVVGFTAEPEFLEGRTEFLQRPLVPFDDVTRRFPPDEHEMYVAVGYVQLNRVRERLCEEARAKRYRLLSYVCSRGVTHWGDTKLGENVFVFEDNTIQPFVEIGDDTILWSGNHVGHHSRIGPHCFITSHVVISGHCRVGSHCFVGVNATIADNVAVADRNLIGAGALIQKDTQPDEVHVGPRATKLPRRSDTFFR